MIERVEEMREVCEAVKEAGSVALDTEFVWERTYFPQLGIVQLALPDQRVFLVDAVALPKLDGLGDILADPEIELLLHDALQDLQILARHTGHTPRHVFDTRLAAGFGGRPATLSLGNLLRDVLDIDLPKEATRTNWLQRPLTDSQISYAEDDVLHLHALAQQLKSDAATLGNDSFMEEEMLRFEDPTQYENTTGDSRYLRMRTDRLPMPMRKALFALLRWREKTAIEHNRPRGHIVQDAKLRELASDLTATPPRKTDIPKRHAAAIHEALRTASNDMTADDLPATTGHIRISSTVKKQIEARRKLMQERAEQAKLDPALIANKAEVTALVLYENGLTKEYPKHLTQGWRQTFTKPDSPIAKTAELDL